MRLTLSFPCCLVVVSLLNGGQGQCPNLFQLQAACLCTPIPNNRVNLVCSGAATAQVIEALKLQLSRANETLKVENLVVRDAFIPQLYINAFQNLKIVTITIQSSQVLKVHPGALAGLEATLEQLSLENNLLTELPTTALEGMTKLQLLNLACNEIPDLVKSTDVLPPLPSLRQVNLNCNKICEMNHLVFTNVRESISTVLLDSNCLQRVPGQTFNGMPNLAAISMANNEISKLKSFDLVDLRSLRLVRLNGNKIETVDQLAFASLPRLEHLILSDNYIRRVEPGAFNQMASLRTLDLSQNQLTTFPVKFLSAFSTLKVLNVSGNLISELNPDPSAVRAKLSLHTLDMSDNCVGTVTKAALADFDNLAKLNLANNNIHTIEQRALGSNVQEVDISQNLFDDKEALKTFSSSAIIFRENPIVCNLGVHYMQQGQGIRLLREQDDVCSNNGNKAGCPTRQKVQRSTPTCCSKTEASQPTDTNPEISASRSNIRRLPTQPAPEQLGITADNNFVPPGASGNAVLPSQLDTTGSNLSPAQAHLKALLAAGAGGVRQSTSPDQVNNALLSRLGGFNTGGAVAPNTGAELQLRQALELQAAQRAALESQLAAQSRVTPFTNPWQPQPTQQSIAALLNQPFNQGLVPIPNLGTGGLGLGLPRTATNPIPPAFGGSGFGSFFPRRTPAQTGGIGGLGSIFPNLQNGGSLIDPSLFGLGSSANNGYLQPDLLSALGLPNFENLLATGTSLLNNLALNPIPAITTTKKAPATATKATTTPAKAKDEESSNMEKVKVGDGSVFLIRAKQVQPQ